MRSAVGISLCLLLGASRAFAIEIADPDEAVNLGGVWLYHEGDNLAFAKPQLDDRQWEARLLPTANAPLAGRLHGRGWYRRHIRLTPTALGMPLMISVGPAREVVEIYVNGSLVARRGSFGSRPRGGPRVIHLAGLIQPSAVQIGDNVIALRVLDPTWEGGIPAGPLLIGLPEVVQSRIEGPSQWAMGLRLTLGMLALCLGLAQVLTLFGRRASRENAWLVGAGVGAAVFIFDGTGVLVNVLPNLELATRLPIVGGELAVLCLASFFASRYDDWGARHVAMGRVVLLTLTAALLLVWEVVIFVAGEAILLLSSLVVALYAANKVSQAARRQEPGAVPLFVALIATVPLLLYDGLMTSTASVMPPMSSVGIVAVLVVTGVVGARLALNEHEKVLAEMLRLRRQAEGQMWLGILNATAMSITHPKDFLNAALHEVARELEVRRCSLVLEHDDGLRISAAIGLPTSAMSQVIPREGGITGWAFTHGHTITSTSMPEELEDRRRVTGYQSSSFITQPVGFGGTILGVLNVSDRNDGQEFTPSEEIAVEEVADKLALVLNRLGGVSGGFAATQRGAVHLESDSFDEALEAAGQAVARATGKHQVTVSAPDWSDDDIDDFASTVLESQELDSPESDALSDRVDPSPRDELGDTPGAGDWPADAPDASDKALSTDAVIPRMESAPTFADETHTTRTHPDEMEHSAGLATSEEDRRAIEQSRSRTDDLEAAGQTPGAEPDEGAGTQRQPMQAPGAPLPHQSSGAEPVKTERTPSAEEYFVREIGVDDLSEFDDLSELDDSELDDSELDDSELDDSELDDSELDDSELDDSELDDSELDDSELDDSELDDSELDDDDELPPA
jgi:hypothetical protein